MVEPHREDSALPSAGTWAGSQSYIWSRDKTGSPVGEIKHGVSFCTFTPGI